MPAEHDGYFGTGSGVLTDCGVGIEDYAESTLGVLLEGDGAWDEVAETTLGEKIGIFIVEVHDHDCHGVNAIKEGDVGDGAEGGSREGRDYVGVFCGRDIFGCFDLIC